MAILNPSPRRISGAIWRLWTDFDAHEPEALLGGVYAAKPGYHNFRDALPSSDYSVEDVAADRRGPGGYASALDISLPPEQMRLYTARLDRAARQRDPRLYTSRGPVLREFIGTLDSRTVYCYVLVGGRPLGVGADAGPDPGRDETHLWHVHLSFIRQFCDDWSALDGVLSVLVGESPTSWAARTREEGNVTITQDIYRLLEEGKRPPGTAQTAGGGIPIAWIVRVVQEIQNEQAAQKLRDTAILAAVQGLNTDEVIRQVDLRAGELASKVDLVDENVVAALPGRTDGDLIALLRQLLGEERTRHLAQVILGAQPA